MTTFELVHRNDVPAERAWKVAEFYEALEAALANPDVAVKLGSITQRQRNRLMQITAEVESNKSKYAGTITTTSVWLSKDTYDVYLTAVLPARVVES